MSVRHTASPLAIVVLWSVFAVLFSMMAISNEFAGGAQIGFCIAAAVCVLLAVLGFVSWLMRVSRKVVEGSKTAGQSDPQSVSDALTRGSVEQDDALPEPLDDLLEIRRGGDDAAEE